MRNAKLLRFSYAAGLAALLLALPPLFYRSVSAQPTSQASRKQPAGRNGHDHTCGSERSVHYGLQFESLAGAGCSPAYAARR